MSRKIKSIIIFFILILSIIVILPTKMVFAAQTSGLDNNKVYHLINKASGKCLNVNYGTDANGTNVNQYTKDGSREQYFKLVYNSSRDSYKLYAMCSSNGGNRVIDIYRPIQAGANVDIWTPDDNDAQDLIIINRGSGYYSLHLRYNTNLALTSYGTGNGGGSGTSSTSTGNVFVTTYSGTNNQLWAMKTGACCHYYVDGGDGADRTNTHTQTKNHTEAMGYSYFSRLNNTSSTTFLNDIRNNEISEVTPPEIIDFDFAISTETTIGIADAMQGYQTGSVSIKSGTLNFRSTPSTSGTILASLTNNTPLRIVSQSENSEWLKVQTEDGQEGYVSSKYVTISNPYSETQTSVGESKDYFTQSAQPLFSPKKEESVLTSVETETTSGVVSITSGTLNVRAAPGVDGKIISSLNKGDSVTILGESESDPNWLKILTSDGQEAYVYSEYIDRG